MIRKIEVLQVKRGYKLALEAILVGQKKPADGEPIFEIDTGKIKFGDGINDYVDLPYFRTGDVEISGSLDGQTLVYNATQDKWEPKALADEKSITYTNDGLKIAGFTGSQAQQGYTPVVNNDTLGWQPSVSQQQLDAAVALAENRAATAGQYATNALNSATAASTAAEQARQFRDLTSQLLQEKFWFGTREEYETEILAQHKLNEGTIYFIRDYNWDAPSNH